MPLSETQRAEPDLPPSSAELVLIRIMVQWFLSRLPKKDRAAAFAELSALMENVAGSDHVFPIRPGTTATQVRKARKQARNWWFAVFGPRE